MVRLATAGLAEIHNDFRHDSFFESLSLLIEQRFYCDKASTVSDAAARMVLDDIQQVFPYLQPLVDVLHVHPLSLLAGTPILSVPDGPLLLEVFSRILGSAKGWLDVHGLITEESLDLGQGCLFLELDVHMIVAPASSGGHLHVYMYITDGSMVK